MLSVCPGTDDVMSRVNWFNWNVPDTTSLYIRGWMQMVFYYHMIYSPETNNQGKTLDYIHTTANTIYNRAMITISHCYVFCAWWVVDVASSPSGSPPGSPMVVLSPLLLQINCLSCSPLGGPGPPYPWWPHFPQGPRAPPPPCPLHESMPILCKIVPMIIFNPRSIHLCFRLVYDDTRIPHVTQNHSFSLFLSSHTVYLSALLLFLNA